MARSWARRRRSRLWAVDGPLGKFRHFPSNQTTTNKRNGQGGRHQFRIRIGRHLRLSRRKHRVRSRRRKEATARRRELVGAIHQGRNRFCGNCHDFSWSLVHRFRIEGRILFFQVFTLVSYKHTCTFSPTCCCKFGSNRGHIYCILVIAKVLGGRPYTLPSTRHPIPLWLFRQAQETKRVGPSMP